MILEKDEVLNKHYLLFIAESGEGLKHIVDKSQWTQGRMRLKVSANKARVMMIRKDLRTDTEKMIVSGEKMLKTFNYSI